MNKAKPTQRDQALSHYQFAHKLANGAESSENFDGIPTAEIWAMGDDLLNSAEVDASQYQMPVDEPQVVSPFSILSGMEV